MEKPEKKKKRYLIVLIIVMIIVAILLGAGVSGCCYLKSQYNKFLDPNAPDIVDGDDSMMVEVAPDEGFVPDDNPVPSDGDEDVTASSGGSGGSSSGGSGGSSTSSWKGTPINKKEQIDENVINILLLGIDVDDFEKQSGRSDSMILLSYNKKTAKCYLYSFHRDCLVQLPSGKWNKLNTTYAFGRAGLTINTINKLFGLDIQQYATVDWSGLRELIDYMGGVTVNLTQTEIDYYGWTNKTAGPNLLNGAEAKRHARNRSLKADDWERSRRQRDILQGIYNKVKTYSLSELSDFMLEASQVVKTNIPFETALSYAVTAVGARDRIEIKSAGLPFSGTYTTGYYNKMSVVRTDFAANREKLAAILYNY